MEAAAYAVSRPRARDAASVSQEQDPLDVDVLADWRGLESEWTTLAAASENVFATPEWVSCWWEHLGRDRERLVVVARERDGRLVGLAPLYVWARRPVTVARLVGHRTAGLAAPACAPDDTARVAAAIRSALLRCGCHVLLADGLPAEGRWAEHLGGRVVNVVPSPTLTLEATWSEQTARFSRNLRQEIGRKERRLERERGLRYELVTGPEAAEDAFDAFLELHARRWRDGGTTLADPSVAAFQRAFARIAAWAGWLRLWFLELDGTPVAAWYGLRFGSTETYYQAGRDPDVDAPSVGTVLLARTIRAAVEDGMASYRFGPGGGAYKYRFADRADRLEVVAVTHGARARAALGAASAARKLQPLRTALHRALTR